MGKTVLTTANPVEGLWSCCKPGLTTAKPVESWHAEVRQASSKYSNSSWRPVKVGEPVMATTKLVEGLLVFGKPVWTTAKHVEGL